MTKQEFIALGLTEEQATKAEEASKKELETYIPKSRFDEVNTAKKQAEADLRERDKQIEDIKKSAGDNEALTQQIATLQAENKAAKEKYEADMKDLKITNAIKLALNGKVYDEDIASGLFDKSKLILGDDGKITGLAEQLESIKTAKSFLFKEEKPAPQPQKPGFNFNIGAPGQPTPSGADHLSLKDAIAAKFTQTN